MVKSFYVVELHQVWGFLSHDLDPQVTSHGGFQAMKVAKLIIDRFIFHCKPSILGYPWVLTFQETPISVGENNALFTIPSHGW